MTPEQRAVIGDALELMGVDRNYVSNLEARIAAAAKQLQSYDDDGGAGRGEGYRGVRDTQCEACRQDAYFDEVCDVECRVAALRRALLGAEETERQVLNAWRDAIAWEEDTPRREAEEVARRLRDHERHAALVKRLGREPTVNEIFMDVWGAGAIGEPYRVPTRLQALRSSPPIERAEAVFEPLAPNEAWPPRKAPK